MNIKCAISICLFMASALSVSAQVSKARSPKHYVNIVPQSNLPETMKASEIKTGTGAVAIKTIKSDVDINIPVVNTTTNQKTFAVIIANENYDNFPKVDFALNDSKVFAEYCKKVLGLPERNVFVYEDATRGNIRHAVNKMEKIAAACKGQCDILFYYAGHGVPNAVTHKQYILPTDAYDGEADDESCYALERLNQEFSDMNANSVVMFIDACFSGSQRTSGDLALSSARAVGISTNNSKPKGNVIVFSAASSQQTAQPYKEQRHGLFTYYLLKKLRDTKGNVTLGELKEYLCSEVPLKSILINDKDQTPDISVGYGFADKWQSHKLR